MLLLDDMDEGHLSSYEQATLLVVLGFAAIGVLGGVIAIWRPARAALLLLVAIEGILLAAANTLVVPKLPISWPGDAPDYGPTAALEAIVYLTLPFLVGAAFAAERARAGEW
jgi:hypothetical protein